LNTQIEQIKADSWRLDHIGIVVRDLKEKTQLYSSLFGYSVGEYENLPEHQVEVQFLVCPIVQSPSPLIELLSPFPGNSALLRFLETKGSLHHLCFYVTDINYELIRLKNMGIRLIDETPRAGSRGMLVSFLHPKSCGGILIELCSKP
jgi:methylmalonyl-CoA/ethylmalonyl-CoA epimerase